MFAVVNMRAINEYVDYIDEINREIENNSHAKDYYYEKNGYYTKIPTSIIDLVNEAIEQDAILAKYALEIALGLFDGTIIPHYTSQELKKYISNTEEHILSRYSVIYSVSNKEIIVLDTNIIKE